MTGWTAVHDRALCAALRAGLSFAAAARALNKRFGTRYTRNATISRAHRIGLAGVAILGVPAPVSRPSSHKAKPDGRSAGKRVACPSRPAAMPLVAATAVVRSPKPGKPVGLLALKREHCRAIVDGRGKDGFALFCGAPRRRGSSYCAEHHAKFVSRSKTLEERHGETSKRSGDGPERFRYGHRQENRRPDR